MLPSHHQARPSEPSRALASPTTSTAVATASSPIKHYAIRSSDVLDQSPRITVVDGDNILWYKTRELTEHEIVDSVVVSVQDSKTNQVRWTIHQPKRGWYLRLRSPMFPPGACIALKPPETKRSAADGTGTSINSRSQDATLAFGCQTMVPQVLPNLGNVGVNDHCYPPSRNSTSSRTSISSLTPRSPKTVIPGGALEEESRDITEPHTARPGQAEQSDNAPTSNANTNTNANTNAAVNVNPSGNSNSNSNRPTSKPPAPRWHITHYILQLGIPQSGPLAGMHHHHHLVEQPSHAPQTSFLHRALAPLANLSNAAGSSHHFTIQPVQPVQLAGLGSISSPSSASLLVNPLNPLNTPNPQTPLAPHSQTFQSTDTPQPPQQAQQVQQQTQTQTQGVGVNVGLEGFSSGVPILAFTDSTPILRATPSGTISVDTEAVRVLGVEMAFWVAVALAFFEFLRDRDGYLAAAED